MTPYLVGTRDLDLTVAPGAGRTVVTVDGEIDCYTSPALREQLLTLIRAGHHHLVLDLDQVEFLDSTGLGVLVGMLKRVRNHDGTLDLVCSQDRILKIFRITGLHHVFPIHPDLAAAPDPNPF